MEEIARSDRMLTLKAKFTLATSSRYKAPVITRGVIIEDTVFFGPRVITMNDKKISHRRPSIPFVAKPPRILHGARVGGGSVLCPGTTVGENALVGAGSVVTKDVADRAIVVGNPARVVGRVPDHEII